QPDEVISGVGFQPLDRAIARTIVNNNDFKIPVCLPVYSFQALADPLPPVVGRHDETGEWVTHADCRHTPRIDLPNSRSSSGSINVERGINLLSQKLICPAVGIELFKSNLFPIEASIPTLSR